MQRSTCDSESKHIQTRNAIGIYLKQSIDLHRKIYSLDYWAPQSEYYTTNFTECVKALKVRIYFCVCHFCLGASDLIMVIYKCIMMTVYLKYDLLSNKAFAVCKEYVGSGCDIINYCMIPARSRLLLKREKKSGVIMHYRMHFSATVILTRLGPSTSYWTQHVWSVSWNRKWEHAFLDRIKITLIWQIDKRYLFI